jgi:hypothetical protein
VQPDRSARICSTLSKARLSADRAGTKRPYVSLTNKITPADPEDGNFPFCDQLSYRLPSYSAKPGRLGLAYPFGWIKNGLLL